MKKNKHKTLKATIEELMRAKYPDWVGPKIAVRQSHSGFGAEPQERSNEVD